MYIWIALPMKMVIFKVEKIFGAGFSWIPNVTFLASFGFHDFEYASFGFYFVAYCVLQVSFFVLFGSENNKQSLSQ